MAADKNECEAEILDLKERITTITKQNHEMRKKIELRDLHVTAESRLSEETEKYLGQLEEKSMLMQNDGEAAQLKAKLHMERVHARNTRRKLKSR